MVTIGLADLLRVITCIIAGVSLLIVGVVIVSNVFGRYPGARWLFLGVALFEVFAVYAQLSNLHRPPRTNLLPLLILLNAANVCVSTGTVIRLRAIPHLVSRRTAERTPGRVPGRPS